METQDGNIEDEDEVTYNDERSEEILENNLEDSKGNIEDEIEEDTELDEIQNNNIEHTAKRNKMNSVENVLAVRKIVDKSVIDVKRISVEIILPEPTEDEDVTAEDELEESVIKLLSVVKRIFLHIFILDLLADEWKTVVWL